MLCLLLPKGAQHPLVNVLQYETKFEWKETQNSFAAKQLQLELQDRPPIAGSPCPRGSARLQSGSVSLDYLASARTARSSARKKPNRSSGAFSQPLVMQ